MNVCRPARLALMAGVALGLAACQKEQPSAPEATSASPAAPETKPGLSLNGARLVLPAVKGNPGAAYFTLVNGSERPVAIAAVDVAGAGMAMLHETKDMGGHSSMTDMAAPELKPGESMAFAPGGKHVMVDDLPERLKPGGTVEMTITFADGDKLSAPLKVEAPGGGL